MNLEQWIEIHFDNYLDNPEQSLLDELTCLCRTIDQFVGYVKEAPRGSLAAYNLLVTASDSVKSLLIKIRESKIKQN